MTRVFPFDIFKMISDVKESHVRKVKEVFSLKIYINYES